jgi:hypothetical protein
VTGHLLLLRLPLQPLNKLLLSTQLTTVTHIIVVDRHLHRLKIVSPPCFGGSFFRVLLRDFQNLGGQPTKKM